MTLQQFLSAWPVILWASTMIFLAGGVWFTLLRMRSDFAKIEPLLAKIAPLEVRVDAAEGEILRLRERNEHLSEKLGGVIPHVASGD